MCCCLCSYVFPLLCLFPRLRRRLMMMMIIISPFLLLLLLFLITPPFLKSVTVCAPLFNSNPFPPPHFFFFIPLIFQRHICMIVLSLPACVESNMKTEMILLIGTQSVRYIFLRVLCCASFAAPIFSILTTVTTTTTTTVLCCLCFLQKEPVSVNYDNDVDNAPFPLL